MWAPRAWKRTGRRRGSGGPRRRLLNDIVDFVDGGIVGKNVKEQKRKKGWGDCIRELCL